MSDEISEEQALAERQTIAEEVFEDKEPVIVSESETEIEKEVEKEVEKESAEEKPAWETALTGINDKLAAFGTIETRLKQTEKRIGGLQNEFFNAKKVAEKPAPSEEEAQEAAKAKKDWEELVEDLPGLSAIDKKIAAQSANVADISKLRESIDAVKKSMVDSGVLERRLVGLTHPGWDKTIRTPAYQTWLSTQPENIKQRASHGETAEEAIDVLNKFKYSLAKPATNIAASREKRLQQAETKATGHKEKPIKSEADMSEAELRKKYEKEVWD